jgi:GNAT superfamily N-acetyltransferase
MDQSFRAWCTAQAKHLVGATQPEDLIPLGARPRLYHGEEIFALQKEIDGAPTVYGSFPLAGLRVSTFLQQWQRQLFYEPLDSYDRILSVVQINNALRDGFAPVWCLSPIMVAFHVFESIFTAPQGRVSLPEPGEVASGAHAVTLTSGWEDSGETLEFDNWWGRGWGHNGRGFVSRAYLDRYLEEAWLQRDASVGPTAFKYHRLQNASSARDLVRAWMLPNPRWQWRFRHAGHGHQLVVYETLSMVDQCVVQVFEVRTGFGIRVGWGYLYHRGWERTAVIKELFVWPSFRRRGYGTLLESIASANARDWGAERLHILFHAMDAQITVRAAGRLFGEHAGYRWRWRKGSHPPVAAIGEKILL